MYYFFSLGKEEGCVRNCGSGIALVEGLWGCSANSSWAELSLDFKGFSASTDCFAQLCPSGDFWLGDCVAAEFRSGVESFFFLSL